MKACCRKSAEETKRGAGQYFTPRVLIDVMVRLMQPKPGETIQDPAAGTGGFLIAANSFMRAATDDYLHAVAQGAGVPDQACPAWDGECRRTLSPVADESLPARDRCWHIRLGGHAFARWRAELQNADLVLTNPPFGPAGGPSVA